MAGSKDRSGSKPGASGDDFDGVWEAMSDRTPDKPDGATKLWDDDVRGARKRDGEDAPEDKPEVVRTSEQTVAWTEESRGALKNDHAGEPEDEMARLMAEAASLPQADEDDEAPAPASTSMVGAAFVETRPAAEPASDAMARLMGKPDADASGLESESKRTHVAETASEPAAEERDADANDAASSAKRGADGGDAKDASAKADDDGGDDTDVAAPIPLRPRASKPVEVTEPEPEPEPAGSRMWLWIAAAVVVGGIGFAAMQSGKDAPAAPSAVAQASSGADVAGEGAKPEANGRSRPETLAGVGEGSGALEENAALANQAASDSDTPTDGAAGAQPKPVVPRSGDPREPPPGTPPEIAEVFRRIPVSAADQPPVGGIGATGVHVDDISMGTGYARSRCEGEDSKFSVADAGQANVCLRVVHQRQKEELVIVWQKKKGHARRGKIVVKGAHAYRTRAYLKLRSEYVGDWDVKILSSDGVELATQSFSVVP